MRVVIVPKTLQYDIDTKIKEVETRDGIELDPESRSEISNQLLNFFDENGFLPEFSLRKREPVNG